MQIRRYKPGEEEELWKLYYDTTHNILGKTYTKEQIERWAPHNQDMVEWKKRLKNKKPFVIVDAHTIIGFAELEPDGHIDYFYVHHEWQGKGVGSILYNAIEEEAINQKVSHLYAEVSVPAKAFFLKQGFKVLEEMNNKICGAPAPNFKMEKKLTLNQ
jgi:GNAT superfamily N-acetyltransferase